MWFHRLRSVINLFRHHNSPKSDFSPGSQFYKPTVIEKLQWAFYLLQMGTARPFSLFIVPGLSRYVFWIKGALIVLICCMG